MGEDVEGGPGHLAFPDGLREGVLVDDSAPGGVDDPDAALALGQGLPVEEARGFGGLGDVDAEVVRRGQEFVQAHEFGAHLGGSFGCHERIVRQDPHAQGVGGLDEAGSDLAEAHDAEDFLVELGAHEGFALPEAGLHGGVGGRDAAGEGEHQGERMLGGRDGIAFRGVDDDDAGLGGGGNVDVVDPDARAADDPQPAARRDDLARDLGGRADHEGVVVADDRQEFVGGDRVAGVHLGDGVQEGNGGRIDPIEHEDLGEAFRAGSGRGRRHGVLLGRGRGRRRGKAARAPAAVVKGSEAVL
ncbi:hypothetical protein D3C87_1059760 [compost metagenome]